MSMVSTIVDLFFGLGIAVGLALFIASLMSDNIGYEVLTIYFCYFMAICLYGDLVEFWMFLSSFILMILVIGYKLTNNKERGI